jgi:hypothetical protein
MNLNSFMQFFKNNYRDTNSVTKELPTHAETAILAFWLFLCPALLLFNFDC